MHDILATCIVYQLKKRHLSTSGFRSPFQVFASSNALRLKSEGNRWGSPHRNGGASVFVVVLFFCFRRASYQAASIGLDWWFGCTFEALTSVGVNGKPLLHHQTTGREADD